MFCKNCLEKATDKLLSDEIAILEYLFNKNASLPQCAISRQIIRDDLDFTSHICYTAISRLECFDMLDKQPRSKSSKYYITESGKFALNILNNKLEGVK